MGKIIRSITLGDSLKGRKQKRLWSFMSKGKKGAEAKLSTPRELHRYLLEVATTLIKSKKTGPLTHTQIKWVLDQVGEPKKELWFK